MAKLLCGVVGLAPSVDTYRLATQMSGAIAPDTSYETSLFQDGNVALAALSFPGPSRVTRHQVGAIAADLELAAPFHSDRPDAARPECLAQDFASDPARALDRLTGEFAFAHWNQHPQVLSLVRDRMGTRSLFYVERPGQFVAFASLMSGLLLPGICNGDLDHQTIARAAVANHEVGERTIYRDIRRVLPGEMVCITPERITRRRYWQIEARDPIPPNAPAKDVFEELRTLTRDAVRRALPENGPAVGHFSGGIDSSAVAVLAADLLPEDQRFQGFAFVPSSLELPKSMIKESDAAVAIAAENPQIDMIGVTDTNLLGAVHGQLDPVTAQITGPDDRIGTLLDRAREMGATRVLSGWGGDQGISYWLNCVLAEMTLAGRVGNAIRLARQIKLRTGHPAWRQILGDIRRSAFGGRFGQHGLSYASHTAKGLRTLASALQPHLREHAVTGLNAIRPSATWRRLETLRSQHLSNVQEELAYSAGIRGLAYASPLLDRAVLEFVVRLPPELTYWQGQRRAPLREMVRGLMPEEARLVDRKWLADPGMWIPVARNMGDILASIDALRGTDAEQVFDIDTIARDMALLPSEDELLKLLREQGTQGRRVFTHPCPVHLNALMYARFMAGGAALSKT